MLSVSERRFYLMIAFFIGQTTNFNVSTVHPLAKIFVGIILSIAYFLAAYRISADDKPS